MTSSLSSSRLCLIIEEKIITMSDMVLNAYRENIQDNHIIKGGG